MILDLDETLIHCNDSVDAPSDHKIKIKFANGDEVEVTLGLTKDWYQCETIRLGVPEADESAV